MLFSYYPFHGRMQAPGRVSPVLGHGTPGGKVQDGEEESAEQAVTCSLEEDGQRGAGDGGCGTSASET